MQEKYDQKYEDHIKLLAAERVKNKKYKIFDYRSRVITKDSFPELVEENRTTDKRCLVIINKEGETLVLTAESQKMLKNALR